MTLVDPSGHMSTEFLVVAAIIGMLATTGCTTAQPQSGARPCDCDAKLAGLLERNDQHAAIAFVMAVWA